MSVLLEPPNPQEELDLSGNHWGTAQPDLPPAFSRLRLGYLSLTNCSLTALPPVAAGMRGLVLLKVNINALRVGGWAGGWVGAPGCCMHRRLQVVLLWCCLLELEVV